MMTDERRKTEIADIDEDPNVEIRPYSSPPCYAHEVDPAYFGLTPDETPSDQPPKAASPVQRLERNRRALEEAAAILTALLSRQ